MRKAGEAPTDDFGEGVRDERAQCAALIAPYYGLTVAEFLALL